MQNLSEKKNKWKKLQKHFSDTKSKTEKKIDVK